MESSERAAGDDPLLAMQRSGAALNCLTQPEIFERITLADLRSIVENEWGLKAGEEGRLTHGWAGTHTAVKFITRDAAAVRLAIGNSGDYALTILKEDVANRLIEADESEGTLVEQVVVYHPLWEKETECYRAWIGWFGEANARVQHLAQDNRRRFQERWEGFPENGLPGGMRLRPQRQEVI